MCLLIEIWPLGMSEGERKGYITVGLNQRRPSRRDGLIREEKNNKSDTDDNKTAPRDHGSEQTMETQASACEGGLIFR